MGTYTAVASFARQCRLQGGSSDPVRIRDRPGHANRTVSDAAARTAVGVPRPATVAGVVPAWIPTPRPSLEGVFPHAELLRRQRRRGGTAL